VVSKEAAQQNIGKKTTERLWLEFSFRINQ